VAVLYCPALADRNVGLRLWPPAYCAYLRAETAQLEVLKEVAPGELGGEASEDKEIGVDVLPRGMSAGQYLGHKERLYQLYDLLLPPFAAGQEGPAADLRKLAAEFQSLFARLAEPPLQPYYRFVGQGFFAWLERVARA
jgi:hypothetical protein